MIDLLISWADPQVLAAVAAIRMRRLMAATGLDAHPELAAATETAVPASHPRAGESDLSAFRMRPGIHHPDCTRAINKLDRGTLSESISIPAPAAMSVTIP